MKVGDTVLVIGAGYRSSNQEGTIVKIGRKYIHVSYSGGIDTFTKENGFSTLGFSRISTIELENAAELRASRTRDLEKKFGIVITYRGPRYTDEQIEQLHDFVAALNGVTTA